MLRPELVCSESLRIGPVTSMPPEIGRRRVLQVLTPRHHHLACVGFGGEVVPGQDLVFKKRVEKNASAAALSKHEPTLPIDCDTPSFRHSVAKTVAV